MYVITVDPRNTKGANNAHLFVQELYEATSAYLSYKCNIQGMHGYNIWEVLTDSLNYAGILGVAETIPGFADVMVQVSRRS